MMSSSEISSEELLQGEEKERGREFKQLLSSLPKHKGWKSSHVFQYQGFWYSPDQLQALLACHRHFEARHNDLLLISTPKSGTVWLKALAFAIVNRMHYTDYHRHPLLTNNPHHLVPFLELSLYANGQVPDLASLPSPRMFATHIPRPTLPESITESGCRMVYLCRSPKDVFISFWKFMNKLRPILLGGPPIALEEAFEMFCMGASEFGPYWEHVLGYWKESLRRPERVLFLKYEDLKGDLSSHLKRLADFLGHPFSVEEEREGMVEKIAKLCSFESLSSLEVNKKGTSHRVTNDVFFRKGEVGDWVNYLSPSMIERLDSLTQEKFDGSGPSV
ncbi:cytosolic sulfotransferase 12 [Cinnamomum micranthum f. kanehirae]|uniref:Sulfotransferase n=1 Tax=Cinnamomum micranthum f. kanehirae TaxID=337451 RepID=A0A3S3Q0R8_9MAGN|nr:cytosolic sulfotransferase 12 [Cinnamomum micranthum f. kanehirae]